MLSVMALAAMAFPVPQARQEAEWQEIRFHRVYLRNGNFIDGGLIRNTEREVAIRVKFGEMVFRRDMVDRVEFIKMRSLKEPPEPEPPKPDVGKKPDTLPPEIKKPLPTGPLLEFPEALRRQVDALLELDSRAVSLEDQQQLARGIQALGPDVVPYLCALIEQRPDSVPLRIVCMTLGEFKEPRAVPSLNGLMKAEAYASRAEAVKALAAIGSRECAPTLVEALNDGWAEVPQVAISALADLHQKFPDLDLPRTLLQKMPKSRGRAFFAETLGRIGGDDVRRGLTNLLVDSDEPTVAAALQGLALMATEEDGPAIQRLLQSRNRGIQQTACVVLTKIKYRPAVPDLIQLLRSEDPGLITTAHMSLQGISAERFSPDPGTWQNWWEQVGSKP